MSAADWLAERRRIEQAATKGPWENDGGGEINQHFSLPEPWATVVSTDVACMAYCYGGSAAGVERDEDAEFIAHARDDVPALLAEVRRLRAMEQRVRELHHRDVAVVITGDCAAEDCNHEELGDCDTIEFAYCAGCAALAEQVDYYFSERDFRPVAWPCPTIAALDGGE